MGGQGDRLAGGDVVEALIAAEQLHAAQNGGVLGDLPVVAAGDDALGQIGQLAVCAEEVVAGVIQRGQRDVAVIEDVLAAGQHLVGADGDLGGNIIFVEAGHGEPCDVPLGVYKAHHVVVQGIVIAGKNIVADFVIPIAVLYLIAVHKGAHQSQPLAEAEGDVELLGDNGVPLGVDIAPQTVRLDGGQPLAEAEGVIISGGDGLGIGQNAPLGGVSGGRRGDGQSHGQRQREDKGEKLFHFEHPLCVFFRGARHRGKARPDGIISIVFNQWKCKPIFAIPGRLPEKAVTRSSAGCRR